MAAGVVVVGRSMKGRERLATVARDTPLVLGDGVAVLEGVEIGRAVV